MEVNNIIEILKNAAFLSTNTKYKQIEEAVDEAIDILEKQIPQKPLPKEASIFGNSYYPCGNCGEQLKSPMWDYCPWCGQKIEWSK